ncbi:hypothetical protein LXL04_016710 [Taraxacum kok-saghyz]
MKKKKLARKNLRLLAVMEEEKLPNHRVYECKDCGKKFDTFQALGGHRASHCRKNLNPNDDGSESSSSSPQKFHQCKLCGSEFPTGQALGGHMRRHQKKDDGDTPAAEDKLVVGVECAGHDAGDETELPAGKVGNEVPAEVVECSRSEVKADSYFHQEQASAGGGGGGEGEMAEAVDDSTLMVAAVELKCCDLNYLPPEDEYQVQERKFYCFI